MHTVYTFICICLLQTEILYYEYIINTILLYFLLFLPNPELTYGLLSLNPSFYLQIKKNCFSILWFYAFIRDAEWGETEVESDCSSINTECTRGILVFIGQECVVIFVGFNHRFLCCATQFHSRTSTCSQSAVWILSAACSASPSLPHYAILTHLSTRGHWGNRKKKKKTTNTLLH